MEDAKIMSFDEISKKLQDRRLSVISKATGITYPTLRKLYRGVATNYNLTTLMVVSKYLTDNE